MNEIELVQRFVAEERPDGYEWSTIPGGSFGSHGLLCTRCGAIVGAVNVHNEWHARGDV